MNKCMYRAHTFLWAWAANGAHPQWRGVDAHPQALKIVQMEGGSPVVHECCLKALSIHKNVTTKAACTCIHALSIGCAAKVSNNLNNV